MKSSRPRYPQQVGTIYIPTPRLKITTSRNSLPSVPEKGSAMKQILQADIVFEIP